MNSDKINGVMDKVVGRAQEVAGDVTGDERLQAEGSTRYVAGAIQEKYGDALSCVSDLVRNKPIATLSILAGVSLLAGLLLRRR
ncbi:CsbD family protein [Serratia quinivorans]|uniref:CsbD family protein n=1 Tax=Serratia quinivorans TaxID=137545 RepID=UPI003F96A6F1